MIPDSFAGLLFAFESCFTGPSLRRFLALMTGWVLCTGKHTVTGVMRAAGVVGEHEHSGYHRFFNGAAWEPDTVGVVLMRLVLKSLSKRVRVNLTIDDTLGRHTGKHISSAGMRRDPLLSSAGKPFWHFGHNWVVLAVAVEFSRWNKVFSLPVLMRLYRSEKVNKKMKRPHKKRTELAVELLALVIEEFPERQFLLLGDNAYINHSVVRNRPKNFHIIGRGRMDAALYAPAPKGRHRGRPRVKGERLASPKDRHGRWAPMAMWTYSLVVLWYGSWSARRTQLPVRLGPWYRTKRAPSFSDMLATLRRQAWTLWISDQVGTDRFDQKELEPLLDAVGYA